MLYYIILVLLGGSTFLAHSYLDCFLPGAFPTRSVSYQERFLPGAFPTRSVSCIWLFLMWSVSYQERSFPAFGCFLCGAFPTRSVSYQERFLPGAFHTRSVSYQERFIPGAFPTMSVPGAKPNCKAVFGCVGYKPPLPGTFPKSWSVPYTMLIYSTLPAQLTACLRDLARHFKTKQNLQNRTEPTRN
jgi:hypothetical protein